MLNHKVIKSAEEILLDTITESNLRASRILAGLSGGADSVTLLRVLMMLSEKYGFSVTACHINHMIRGEEADRDELFVRNLCKMFGIKLFVKRADVPKIAGDTKKGLEEAARDVRYEYFSKLCAKGEADYIATAHNACDNAETVIFNITRGCGIPGICGIPVMRDNIVRPLLYSSRGDIEDFLILLDQPYVTDSTNFEDDCSRNIIRHRIIPVLRELNPAVINQITRLSELAGRDNGYLECTAKENMTDEITALAKLDDAVLSRIIGIKYSEKCGNMPGMTHIDMLCGEIKKAAKNNCGERKAFDLPGNIKAVFECGRLYMISGSTNDNNLLAFIYFIIDSPEHMIFSEAFVKILNEYHLFSASFPVCRQRM